MRKYRTDKEVREALATFTVVIDTREQVNHNILEYLSNKKIPYISRKLDVGDYSFELEGLTFEDTVAVERKASIDEIAGNFTADRTRFENEFLRAKANGTKVFLLIENCSWHDIKSHNYKSKLKPESLTGSLLSWQSKFDISMHFVKPEFSGELLVKILYYWARASL